MEPASPMLLPALSALCSPPLHSWIKSWLKNITSFWEKPGSWWSQPMSSKPDSFCSCSHLLPRMGLLGGLRSWQGRIESYQAGKIKIIAFAGKLAGHVGNIWYTCMIRILTSALAWWQVMPITHCQPMLTPSLSNLFRKGATGEEGRYLMLLCGFWATSHPQLLQELHVSILSPSSVRIKKDSQGRKTKWPFALFLTKRLWMFKGLLLYSK